MTCYGQKEPDKPVTMRCNPCTIKGFETRLEKICNCKINSGAETADQLFLLTFSVKKASIDSTFDIALKGHPFSKNFYRDAAGNRVYEIYFLPAAGPAVKNVTGHHPAKMLKPVLLTFFNGFDHVPAMTTPGAFHVVEKKELSRVISPNMTAHIIPAGSGILAGPGAANPAGFSIHGIHTFQSYPSPLIIRDNFPIAGGLSTINPLDIETITILKDAVSAAPWGGFSSNNLLVLSSAQGKYNSPMSITMTMNTSFTQRPRLLKVPRLSTDSFISAERQFYNNGYYNDFGPNHPYTPAVVILQQRSANALTDDAANHLLTALGKNDLLAAVDKYFYRPAVSQQYHAGISGGGANSKYYLGLGIDHDPTTLMRNRDDRFTLHSNYTFRTLSGRLETSLLFGFADINRRLNNTGSIPISTPYDQLADVSGNPLALAYQYNDIYMDTVGGGGHYLDTRYRPLEELRLADNRYSHRNAYGEVDLNWHAAKGLTASGLFRLYRDWSSEQNFYNAATYFVRDNVNFKDVPYGDMKNSVDTTGKGYNLRTQLRYTTSGGKPVQLISLLGAEFGSYRSAGVIKSEQGLGNPKKTSSLSTIPGTVDRYASIYSNLSLALYQRYSLFGSYRIDAANFIGIDVDQQWVPFWAMGYAQQLLKLDTTKGRSPALLKARLSYGRNGNHSNRNANLSTQLQANSIYGTPQTGIVNAQYPGLTYEKSYVATAGLDFNLLRDSAYPRGRIYGSIDVYRKRATDLLARDTLAPATGWSNFISNSGGITGNGLDLVLNTVNIRGPFEWTTSLLLSIVHDKVSRYRNQPSSPLYYVQRNVPMVGRSPAGLYSYKLAGLDPANGDPRGWLGNHVSNDYVKLQNDTSAGMVYSGSWQPQFFGNVLNSFTYKNFCLSLGFSFEAGFYIRRPGVNYSGMADGLTAGNPEFSLRWMKPGDEKKTSIPSLPVTISPDRDNFYNYSTATIVRGDYIRWRDCQLGYSLDFAKDKPLKQAIFYLYVANLGLIWRANRYKIDPDAATNPYNAPTPKSFSLGTRLNF